MNMTFDGYLLGKGNKPGGVVTDRTAIVSANELRRKLAEAETGRKAWQIKRRTNGFIYGKSIYSR
ncbi:hypothetical protein CHCC20487_3325 [Bacillus licheniformis]|jgi:hypothetical protein|nr:hypothetical protein CHCC20487_3325 [Bacillus licheniformis]